jgi:hypothetical protein
MIMKSQIDGFVREIHICSDEQIYDVVITPDGSRSLDDFTVKLPKEEALALSGLIGKKCRVILTPTIVAR